MTNRIHTMLAHHAEHNHMPEVQTIAKDMLAEAAQPAPAPQSEDVFTPEQHAAHLEAMARSLEYSAGDAPVFDDLGDAMGIIPWGLGAIIIALGGLAYWGWS